MALFRQLFDERDEGFSFRKKIREFGKPKSDTPQILGKDAIMVGEQDKSFRPAIDRELDIMIGFVMEGRASSLQGAYNLWIEDSKKQDPEGVGSKPRDFSLYVGRALKDLEDSGLSPILKELNTNMLNLPVSIDDVKNYNFAKRSMKGLSRDAMQVTRGATTAVDTLSTTGEAIKYYTGGKPNYSGKSFGQDSIDILDDKIAEIDEYELIWKAYNATQDKSKPSGINLPFNIGGGIGESLLATATGGYAATRFNTLRKQAAGSMTLNTTYEGLRAAQHGDPVEAGIGIASGATELLPLVKNFPLNQTAGGRAMGNLMKFDERSRRAKDLKSLDFISADKSLQGLDLIDNGGVEVPYNILYRVDKTIKSLSKKDKAGKMVETDRQHIINTTQMVKDYEVTSARMLDSSLDRIGPKFRAEDVPEEWAHAPGGYQIKEYFNGISKQIKKLAKVEDDKWKEAAKNMPPMSVADVLRNAKLEVTDNAAIAHINAAYKSTMSGVDQTLNKKLVALNIKLKTNLAGRNKGIDKATKFEEDIALEQLTLDRYLKTDKTPEDVLAKQQTKVGRLKGQHAIQLKENKASISEEVALDQQIKGIEADTAYVDMEAELPVDKVVTFVKNLNNEIYGSSSFIGMDKRTKTQLQNFSNIFRDKLGTADEAFSIPWQKSNDYYKSNFDMLDSDMPGSISGLQDALEDGTGEKLSKLFSGERGFMNLQKLGKWMPSDSPLYGSLVRQHLDSNISPTVRGIDTITNLSSFDGQQLSLDFAGVDFDLYRSLLPTDGEAFQAVNNVAGVTGLADMVGTQFNELKNIIKQNYTLEDMPYTINWKNNFKDNTLANLGLPSEFPADKFPGRNTNDSTPGWLRSINNMFEKAKAPDTANLVYEGPTVEAAKMQDLVLKKRASEKGSELVQPTNQSVDGLILLQQTEEAL